MTNPKIVQGHAIAQAQAQDQSKSIPYRPQYNLITSKVTASILLQQISYWWHTSKRRPFYKFRAPCEHEKYRGGDSWTEELGMTGAEFDTALAAISKKITKGTSKTEALKDNLVVYWTDSDRITWYQLNEPLHALMVYGAYHEPELLGNLGFLNYLENSGKSNYLENSGKSNYIPSEITTETITETTSKQQQLQKLDINFSTALKEYQNTFGPLGSQHLYAKFQMLWDEYPKLETHKYARKEMYQAMMREEGHVRPNLGYYAQCLATGAARADGKQQERRSGTKRRDAPKRTEADPNDPDIKAWLEKRRQSGESD